MNPEATNKLVNFLRSEWQDLCDGLSGSIELENEIFDSLTALYGEQRRAYHNLNHVRGLLDLAAELRENFDDFDTVRFSIWFHDAVYNPKQNNNEEQSAVLAVKNLTQLTVSETQIETVRQMILATKKHDSSLLDDDGKLFLDLDLSILGAEENDYQKYAAAIRREYDFVPEALYRSGRKQVLENFLRRDFIYFTFPCREKFEAQARKNIEKEIADLSR